MTATGVTPELSIVVALISGQVDDLDRCLTALERQVDLPATEVLVPYDEPCRGVLALASRHPLVRFLPLEGVDTRQARAGASREHHDWLRTLGLREARGRLVILTEDHAHADPHWAAALLEVLAQRSEAACAGGAVEWGGSTTLSFAVYLCDFGRYQNPLPEAPATFVSDSNVCYRRDALDRVATAWAQQYQETVVHGALTRAGAQLWLTPRAVVWQARQGLTWRTAMAERFVWGRSYAASRVPGAAPVPRLLLAAATPLLPVLLTWRLVDAARQKQRETGRTLRTIPALLALNACWALGELVGYLTARAA